MISTVRRCQRCAAILPAMAFCDGAGLPEEPLAQIEMAPVEFTLPNGVKQRGVIPTVCLQRYRGEDGRVRFPEITS